MPVIALDLGGTKLATALVSDDARILFTETTPLQKREGPEVGALVSSQSKKFVTIAEQDNLSVSSLGICVPGIFHAKTGTVWAPNIRGWEDYPLLDELKKEL